MKTKPFLLLLLLLTLNNTIAQNNTGYLHASFNSRQWYQYRLPGFFGETKNFEKNAIEVHSYDVAVEYSFYKKHHFDFRAGFQYGKTDLYFYDQVDKYYVRTSYSGYYDFGISESTYSYANAKDLRYKGGSSSLSASIHYEIPSRFRLKQTVGLSVFLTLQYIYPENYELLVPKDYTDTKDTYLYYEDFTSNDENLYYSSFSQAYGQINFQPVYNSGYRPFWEVNYELSYPIRSMYFPTVGLNAGFYPKMFDSYMSGSKYYSLSLKFSVLNVPINLRRVRNQLRLRKSAKKRSK